MTSFEHAIHAIDVRAGFETCERTGLRYAWLGEDGEGAVIQGHNLDPKLVALALDLDAEVDPDEYDGADLCERTMVGLRHSQGCDDPHDCGCDEYAWWVEWVDGDEAAALAGYAFPVTEWTA